ncbi:Ni/Fe hydrogenase subunit alpha [Candidatus Woesearchaeota archaeon]|nr:Ni/Fe hydrogenase subunit alpha [Candidatus Woesearchaeota archaeon]
MSKTITLNHITKIEGHASLSLGIKNDKVTKCELSATEGSRYFEGIVKGRRYYEAHEMTSRICGVCSCAHVVAAISAVENAFGYKPSKQTKQLRELMTLGERIRSHATHLYFLALPDYVGYGSALAMAKKYRKELQNALNLMKCGNGIIKLLGARELHPVSATVGGWLKIPKEKEIENVKKTLISVREDALKTFSLFSSLNYPEFETESVMFSLVDKNKYSVLDGTFSSGNMKTTKKKYREHIKEYQVPHSNANFVTYDNYQYQVGAMARINNNKKQLHNKAKKLLNKSKIKFPSKNPYTNNFAQAVELVHCIEEAIKLCDSLNLKEEKLDKLKVKAGTGIGCIEVPRGTLWHEYTLDKKGIITNANIITPTAQNLFSVQEDIKELVPSIIKKKKKDIIMDIEKLIRSYDPCFSCSAHFLEVKWV